MKKIAAFASAVIMAVSVLPAAEVCAEYSVSSVGTISFGSVDDLAEYIYENGGNVRYDALTFLMGTDTMYNVESIRVPAGFSEYTDYITEICFNFDNISVEFVFGDVTYRLHSYFYSEAGEDQYKSLKKSGEYKKVNGRTVYRKDVTPWDECYSWKQGGVYYVLRVTGSDNDYSLCSAEEYILPEYVKEGIRNIRGRLYYVQRDGSYYVGWKTVNGKKYFFGMDGAALTKNTVVGNVRYTFDINGVCTGKYTGWVTKNGYRYYYKNGRYVTGINKISGKIYNFNENGILMY